MAHHSHQQQQQQQQQSSHSRGDPVVATEFRRPSIPRRSTQRPLRTGVIAIEAVADRGDGLMDTSVPGQQPLEGRMDLSPLPKDYLEVSLSDDTLQRHASPAWFSFDRADITPRPTRTPRLCLSCLYHLLPYQQKTTTRI